MCLTQHAVQRAAKRGITRKIIDLVAKWRDIRKPARGRSCPMGRGHIIAKRASGESRRFELLEEAEDWLNEEASLH